MAGDGDIELNQERAYSQDADKPQTKCVLGQQWQRVESEPYENEKLTYKGETPLVGEKYLKSKEFYGGFGANV